MGISTFLVMAVVGALAGCHSYTGVSLTEINRGDAVRAEIQGDAESRLPAGLGEGRADLEGEVLEVRDDSVILELFTTPVNSRKRATTLRQRVVLSERDLESLEIRRTDVLETGLIVGGGALAVTAFLYQRSSSGGGVVDPPDGTTPQGLSLPLSIPLP